MMPDRTLLLIALLTQIALLMRVPPFVAQSLAWMYAAQALRSHRLARASYVRPAATNSSSTARCASSIA
jgi:hypothetical protein